MSDRCRRRRRATTLIEVLLGLVILSTLLVSVAIARGRFLRQWADADRRIDQAKAADELMTRWLAGPPALIPLQGEGNVDRIAWRTRVVPSPAARSLGAAVVRLSVYDHSHVESQAVTLDFLVRDARVPRDAGGGAMRAFTLIEMLVAVVLSAVLMAALLSMIGGVARDRHLLRTLRPPAPTTTVDLIEWDLRNARTIITVDDAVVLRLVGNDGIDETTLQPNGRFVQVTYRAARVDKGPAALWRQQEYVDDPARPAPWQELVAADFQSLSLLPAPDEVTPVPARLRIEVVTTSSTQTREVIQQ